LRFSEVLYRLLFWGAFVVFVPMAFIWLMRPDYFSGGRIDQFHHVADRITAVSLGSSHSRAIHFPSLGFNGHSFADDRGDIRTAVIKARYILPYTPDLKYVLIPVSPGYLSFDRKLVFGGTDPDLLPAIANAPWPKDFWSLPFDEEYLLLRAHVFTLEMFETANRLTKETIKNAMLSALGKNQEMFRDPCRVRTNPADFPDESGIRNGYTREPMPASCLPAAAGAEAAFHTEQIGAILQRDEHIRAENTKLLEELAKALARRGIELVLFVPPLPVEYYGTEGLRMLAREEQPFIEQLTRLPNVRLHDFHGLFPPGSYRQDNRYFSDGNHLTLAGAKAFSKVLGEAMRGTLEPASEAVAGATRKLLPN
jgi:hypothetical protein